MKLTEFQELCEREWGEARGYVTGLHLTDESYDELYRDVIMDGGRTHPVPLILDIDKSELAALRAGERFPPLLNHITRTSVKVAKGADEDTASVRRYYAEPHPAGA